MSYYRQLGSIPHKRHTQFRQADGSLYHEEVMGIHGFAGIQSILYHVNPPTRVQEIARHESAELELEEAGPLRHRRLKSASLPRRGDAISGRVPLLGNTDVVLCG
jgi:homogentisate 1,2-dioxygenase